MNKYKDIIAQNLPRLLNLYDMDQNSSSYGFGDRLYWGWKISDFVNGTYQGGLHTISIALKLNLIKEKTFILKTIDSIIRAVKLIQGRDGSLEEAYPSEKSYCVTALVAFDILYSINHLKGTINDDLIQEYLEIIRPLIKFIVKADETHAFISNHLATAAAACIVWEKIAGERVKRGYELLNLIYRNQSDEGWYLEYGGADPGYQTLCTHYLFLILENLNDERLLQSLRKNAAFLKYFIHPDGTIGGLYGSRNTEVLYPGGIIGLADKIEDFAHISSMLHQKNYFKHGVLPNMIDGNNFIPLLNSYAVAAMYYEKNKKIIDRDFKKPTYDFEFCKMFGGAGIYIHSTKKYYSILNFKKGGTLKVFNKETGNVDLEDGGIFGYLKNNKKFSTQQYDQTISFENKLIKCKFYLVNERFMTPISNIIIRFLALTVFRIRWLGELFKKNLVKMLMTGKTNIDGRLTREFKYLDDRIIVKENVIPPAKCIKFCHPGKSRSIHMASSGYHTIQQESMPEKSNIVEFIIKDDTKI